MNRLKGIFAQYLGQSRSVYVLFFGRTVTSMGALIWPMLTLILSRKMGYSVPQVGLMLIIIGFIFLPATWIGGKLADRFSRKKLIVIMDTISVLFYIGCVFLDPGILMLIFFVAAGWFAHMEAPVYEALIMDVTKPSEREMAYSMVYLGRNLGMIIGTALGGLLFEHYLSIAFAIDGLTTFLSTIFIVAFVVVVKTSELDEKEKNDYEEAIDGDEKTFSVLKDRKSLFMYLLILFMIGLVYDQYSFIIPLYMIDIYGAQGSFYYGLIAAFNAGIVIILTPILTKVSERYNELPKVMAGVLLFSTSYLIIIGSPIFIIFFIFMFVFTVGEILNMLGTSPFVSRRVPETHRGRVNSYVYIAFFLGTMTGKGIFGLIIEYTSFTMAFILLAVAGGVTMTLTWYNYNLDQHRFPKLYNSPMEYINEND